MHFAPLAGQTFGNRRYPPLPAPQQPDAPAWHAALTRWHEYAEPLRDQIRAFISFIAAADQAPAEPARVHPALQPKSTELRATLVRLLAYLGGITALALVSAHLFRGPDVIEARPLPPRPEWVTLAKPYAAFLLAPELGEYRYSIMRHSEGGGRKDVMTIGEPGHSLRYMMIEIYRPGRELGHFADPATEVALRAADFAAGETVRASLPLQSKFGSAATVEFAAGKFGNGHCIGFARAFAAPRLQITGLACDMESMVSRRGVSCALDGLTLLSAGSDGEIAKLFADAEIKRTFCGRREPILAATPKRPDHSQKSAAVVKLRGSVAAR